MARILIVDDSRTTRRILRQILEDKGYEVVGEAVNGEDGIAKYKELKPDLTTMDITMPGLDGVEALRQIKEYDPDAKKWLVSNYVRNFHRVSKWFKPPGGSPEFVQG